MAIPSQLLQQFLRVEKRYSINPNEEPFFDLPPNLVLERLEYTAPTQQEIEDMARAKLIVAFNKKQDHIEEQYAKTVGKKVVKNVQLYSLSNLVLKIFADDKTYTFCINGKKSMQKLKLGVSGNIFKICFETNCAKPFVFKPVFEVCYGG